MKNHSKLIAIIDLSKLRLYEAQGLRITKEVEQLPLSVHKEHRHNKGLYQQPLTTTAGYDSHADLKEMQYNETAKIITSHLDKFINENTSFKELIIAAEPKMLGFIRSNLSNNLKKIVSDEIIKDLANHDMAAIQRTVFPASVASQ